MSEKTPSPANLLWPVGAAFILWFFAFAVSWGNFWLKISLSAAFLALVSLRLGPPQADDLKPAPRALLLGIASAAALYLLFLAGKTISGWLFWFAGEQIGGIYHKGDGTPTWVITLLLFFVTGPAEEIFWRGYLQKGLARRLGPGRGYLLATAFYTAVHLPAMNFMLIGAAAVAGAFWGAMYWRFGSLAAQIISHSIWSSVIFAVLPMR